MEMISVNSSAIAAIGYDPASSRMRIRFVDSGEYDYFGVPEHIFRDFLSAASKGSYFHRHIKDRYGN